MKGKNRKKSRRWPIPVLVIALLIAAFLIYTGRYYRAGDVARSMLESDETVLVTRTDYGWLFDGPSEGDALIFYPGAKVEETAYAPLLHAVTEEGCLSLDGMRKATRYQNIEIEYRDASWKAHRQRYSGWIAQIIQHELDHLEGILI